MKLQLADLIELKRKAPPEMVEIEIPSLGGSVDVKRMPARRFYEMLENFGGAEGNPLNQFDFNVALVYASIPVLHSAELQEAWGVKVPEDIVMRILQDDITALSETAGKIVALYGLGETEELKN